MMGSCAISGVSGAIVPDTEGLGADPATASSIVAPRDRWASMGLPGLATLIR